MPVCEFTLNDALRDLSSSSTPSQQSFPTNHFSQFNFCYLFCLSLYEPAWLFLLGFLCLFGYISMCGVSIFIAGSLSCVICIIPLSVSLLLIFCHLFMCVYVSVCSAVYLSACHWPLYPSLFLPGCLLVFSSACVHVLLFPVSSPIKFVCISIFCLLHGLRVAVSY